MRFRPSFRSIGKQNAVGVDSLDVNSARNHERDHF